MREWKCMKMLESFFGQRLIGSPPCRPPWLSVKRPLQQVASVKNKSSGKLSLELEGNMNMCLQDSIVADYPELFGKSAKPL